MFSSHTCLDENLKPCGALANSSAIRSSVYSSPRSLDARTGMETLPSLAASAIPAGSGKGTFLGGQTYDIWPFGASPMRFLYAITFL